MTHYLVQPRYRIFVKGYKFLQFARKMDKNVRENMIKNVSSKFSQEPLDDAKQSTTDALKTALKNIIQKTGEEHQ